MTDSPRQKAVKAARSAGVVAKLQSEDCDLGTTPRGMRFAISLPDSGGQSSNFKQRHHSPASSVTAFSHGKTKRNKFAGVCTAADREHDVLLPLPHVTHR
jgi:hypothetical protein